MTPPLRAQGSGLCIPSTVKCCCVRGTPGCTISHPLTVPAAVPVAWDRAGHGPPIVPLTDEEDWRGCTV